VFPRDTTVTRGRFNGESNPSRPSASGFDSSFLVEHHFNGWNQVSATLMPLTALAMRTPTMHLGSAVTPVAAV
jgi:alkanesulfonate monooxygenase SsuD/methylene tetrahydromethanopterin reductase-like flavin-dependent oxidoreductase (luciferase family)